MPSSRNSPKGSIRPKRLPRTSPRYKMKYGICAEITKTGKQCTRKAIEGSEYCKQHGEKRGEKEPIRPSPYSTPVEIAPISSIKVEKSAASARIGGASSSSLEVISSGKITIGNYSFRPLGKIRGGRELIEIESTNLRSGETQIFRTYISNSEGGLLRYCSNREGGGYEKGRDYVTDTFIDMNLQKFIKERLALLPVLSGVETECIMSDREPAKSFFALFDERLVDIPSLNILRICPAGECIKNYQLLRFLNMDYLLSESERDPVSRPYPVDRLKLRDRMIATNKYYQEFLKIVNDIHERQKGRHPKNTDFSDEDTSLYWKNLLLDSLNTYLSRYIQLTGPEHLRYLYSDTSIIEEPEVSITVNNNYYSLPARIEGVTVDLIFNKYTFSVKNSKGEDIRDRTAKFPYYVDKPNTRQLSDGNYCVLVNMVPVGSGVLFNGTYSKIVSVGLLVYKPFEHNKQVDFIDAPFCSYQYAFIGDFVSKFFPTSVMCEYSGVRVN